MATDTAATIIEERPALPLGRVPYLVLMTALMLGTLMQVLDSTIANVALPHMRGALGASPDSINWVLTSYIVAAAVATPLTGWMANRFGRRALLIAAYGGFTIASAACAGATSIGMMVVSRLLQGAFGALLMPLAQGLMLDVTPKSKHASTLTIWGLVAMVGPVAGPVLGGWLTDAFNWRWVFLINLPFGAVSTAAILFAMPRTAAVRERFDTAGFVYLLVAIGGLQLMLDRGTQNDWFGSAETVLELAAAAGFGWMLVVHTLTAPAPLLPRHLFRDRNLVIAATFAFIAMGLVIASSAILPPMLQTLLGYDAFDAGLATAPRGLGMALSIILAGRLTRRIDPRLLILVGLTMTAIGTRLMMGFSLGMDRHPVIVAGFIQGTGFGFVLLPLNTTAFATLAPADRTAGASLYALGRNIGGSVFIAMMSALLVRQTQISHADIGAHVTSQTIPLIGAMNLPGFTGFALSAADAEVSRQAAMIAYLDCYKLMFWLLVAVAPLVLLMRPPARVTAEELAHAAAVE